MKSRRRRPDYSNLISGSRSATLLIARLLIAALFVAAIWHNIAQFPKIADALALRGLPRPEFILISAVGIMLVGSVSFLVGYRIRPVSIMLALLVIPVSIFLHPFWLPGHAEQFDEFFRNLAVAGGLLYVGVHGAGGWSIGHDQE